MTYYLGVDIGGTFTDCVAVDESGRVFEAKVPSTHQTSPVDGVLAGLGRLAEEAGLANGDLYRSADRLSHGTTIGTNLIVERNGARVGLLATAGHGDALAMMRGNGRTAGVPADQVFSVHATAKPTPLVDPQNVVEVSERVASDGEVVAPLNEAEVSQRLRALLADQQVDAIAIALLWSFRNPDHERRLRQLAQELAPDTFVSISSELGAAYVDCLLGEGAAVVANDLDRQALAALAEREPVAVVPGDISDPATAPALVAHALSRFGRLDGIVANAGLLRSGPLLKLAVEDFDAVLAVHVRATFLALQAAAGHWRAEAKAGRPAGGAAVTTTSSAGLYGFLGEAAYSAAKAAVAALTVVAAEELARYEVTVNAVAPVARTRMTAWMGEADSDEDAYDPAHVAPVVAWLLGPAARGVTARVFEVGGDRLSVAEDRRPGDAVVLPRRAAPAELGPLLEGLIAGAPAPQPVLRADPSLLVPASSLA